MSAKWDHRFLDLATHIASWSKDPSTKVGCVVVGSDREIRSTGFNGFPRGIDDDDDRLTDRSKKYPLICHAEENAIMHAARIGMTLKDCVAYVTWPPCSAARARSFRRASQRSCFPTGARSPSVGRKTSTPPSGCCRRRGEGSIGVVAPDRLPTQNLE